MENEKLVTEWSNEFKICRDKFAKANYLPFLNAFILLLIYLGIAPEEVELFDIGFKIPTIFAPLVILIVHLGLHRLGIEEMIHLHEEAKMIVTGDRFSDDTKGLNEWRTTKTNLYDRMSLYMKPNPIAHAGLYVSFVIFCVVGFALLIRFLPEYMEYYASLTPSWFFTLLYMAVFGIIYLFLYYGPGSLKHL